MKKPLVLLILISLLAMGACDRREKHRENPLLAPWAGNFGLPDFGRIEARDYIPAFEEAIVRHGAELAAIVGNDEEPSFENTILAFDNSGAFLRRLNDIYDLLGDADTDEALEGIKAGVEAMLSDHRDAVYMDGDLFDKVRLVYDSRETAGLDYMQRRLTEKVYADFVRGGALLSPQEKDDLRDLHRELAVQQTEYGRRLFRATKDACLVADSTMITGLPFAIRDTAARLAREAGRGGQFIFTLDDPIFRQTMTFASNRALREELYTLWVERCRAGGENDNRQAVSEIVRLRASEAKLLGYESYDEFVIGTRMAGSPRAAYAFLGEIWKPAREKALEELALLDERRPRKDSAALMPWDIAYYGNRVLKSDRHIDREQLDVFFSVDNVRLGAFELANRLFGVTFRPVLPKLYASGCDAYQVLDIDNRPLGMLILDYYPRPGKKNGAWIQPLGLDPAEAGDSGANRAVCLQFNFMRSNSGGRNTLLAFEEAGTMFRKVGDALTLLFVDVPYRGLERADPGLSGVLGALMERWAFERQMLVRYAIHYSSGSPIGANQVGNIVNIGNFGHGCRTVTESASAYLDLDVHSAAIPEPFEPVGYEQRQLREVLGMSASLDPLYGLTDFGPVFDGSYAAAYYEGLWADALAAEVYPMFERDGDIYDRREAARFRSGVIAKGGSYPPGQLFRDFSGRGISVEPFLVGAGFIDPPVPEQEEPTAPGATEPEADDKRADTDRKRSKNF